MGRPTRPALFEVIAVRASVVSRWIVVVALLLTSVSAAPAMAQSEFDLRGTWIVRFGGDTGASAVKLVINRQGDDGAIAGRYLAGDTVWRLAGTVKGDDVSFTIEILNRSDPGRFRFQGTVHDAGGRLQIRGTDENLVVTEPLHRFTADQRLERSPLGGTRASATLVVCDRDMTVNTDDAVLECTAQVTDASAGPGSTAPTGSVAWTAKKGTITPEACLLVPGGGSTSWCAVTLRARPGEIPIGTAPPVTAAYPGDARYGPSESSPKLYGAASGLTESDQYGPTCNPASIPYPSVGCGDPVNPATGNLAMRAVDLAVGGRGPGLAVARTYNSLAAASGETGRFGPGWSDGYGARIDPGPKGRVTAVLGSGATVPFTAAGRRFTAPGWVTASLARGANKGYVLTFRDRSSLAFDRDGRLTTISDRSGEPVSLTYATDGSLATVTDSSGRVITFTSDAAGRVVSATDPAGRTVRYGYDAAGDLVTVTDVAGGSTGYSYDAQHRLIAVTDATGARTTNRYDESDRVAGQTDPLGNTLAFAYLGTYPDGVTVVTDGNGNRSSWEYRKGVPVAQTRGLDADVPSTTSYVYDDRLALVATIDPNGGLWRKTRDAASNVLSATDPLGRTTRATYDDQGNLTSVVSPMGFTTRVDHDDRGLPLRVVRAEGTPDEASVTLGRDDREHPADVTSVTDPVGARTLYTYDEHGDVISRTDALGNLYAASRDDLGWLRSLTDPLGSVSTVTPDRHGRPVDITDRAGARTSFVRDAIGRPTAVTDALGNTATLTHDATGRTTEITLPDGAVLATAYDGIGDPTSQTDGNAAVWMIQRDDLGRQTGWVDPLGNAWQVAYDAAGRVTGSTDPLGRETRYEWDAAGQLVAIVYPDGAPGVTFAYDLDERRTAMTDGTGTTRYAWDALGRLVSVTDGAGRTVATTYDAAGNTTSMVYPGGLVVERDHDANGRLVAVRDWLGHESTFEWDAAGRLVRTVAGNGSVTERTFDARGGVVALALTATSTDGPLLAFAYERDPLGRVDAVTESLSGGTVTAARDSRGRLTALGEERFSVDAAGNLTELRGQALTYDVAGRLLSADGPSGTITFTSDAAGQRTASDPGAGRPVAYTWDAAGRLAGFAGAAYAYDGDGLRTSATWADGSTGAFTWLRSAGLPLLLGDGTSWFVHGPGGILLEEIRADGSVLWLHTDQAGSVRALTDEAGTLAATFTWDAYGLPVARTGDAQTRIGFQSHYTDPDTELHHLQARFYDPATGQFLGIDPLVRLTREPYAFANGDPLTFGDPSGTSPWLIEGPQPPALDALGLPTAAVCKVLDQAAADLPSVSSDLEALFKGPTPGPGLPDLTVSDDVMMTEAIGTGMQEAIDAVGPLTDMGQFAQQALDDVLRGRMRPPFHGLTY